MLFMRIINKSLKLYLYNIRGELHEERKEKKKFLSCTMANLSLL